MPATYRSGLPAGRTSLDLLFRGQPQRPVPGKHKPPNAVKTGAQHRFLQPFVLANSSKWGRIRVSLLGRFPQPDFGPREIRMNTSPALIPEGGARAQSGILKDTAYVTIPDDACGISGMTNGGALGVSGAAAKNYSTGYGITGMRWGKSDRLLLRRPYLRRSPSRSSHYRGAHRRDNASHLPR